MLENPNAIFDYASEAKIQRDLCLVCEGATKGVWRKDRYGYDVLAKTCQTCWLRFLGEQMTRAGYARFYAGGYRALVAAVSRKDAKFVRTEGHGTVPLYTRIVVDTVGVHPIKTILDAGGSTGSIGRAVAARYGANFAVLDPAYSEMPSDVTRIHGWLEDPIPGEYDLAICVATSDHLTDPIAAFANLRRVSKRLYVDYIDVRLKEKLGMKSVLKIDHPLYWSGGAMRRALVATGWKPYAVRLLGDNGRYMATALACEAVRAQYEHVRRPLDQHARRREQRRP